MNRMKRCRCCKGKYIRHCKICEYSLPFPIDNKTMIESEIEKEYPNYLKNFYSLPIYIRRQLIICALYRRIILFKQLHALGHKKYVEEMEEGLIRLTKLVENV